METLIIEGETEQIETLKAFLRTVGLKFRIEPDETEYLLSNEANRRELLQSIQEAKEGKTTKINLDDIWK